MQGPRHLPTYIESVNQERDLIKHYRKLEEIHHTRKRDALDAEYNNRSKIYELREKTMKFQNSEKALNIERENELLLGKLVEISRKKSNIFGKTENKAYGSLNAPARRREKDRIAQENEAFARRLLSQQPSFNRKKLEVDYVKHNERVKNMQKMMFSPKFKLPPLRKEEFETRAKSGGSKEREEKPKKKKKNQASAVDHAHSEKTQTDGEETRRRLEEEEAKLKQELEDRETAAKEQAEKEKAEQDLAAAKLKEEEELKAQKEKAEKEVERLEQERLAKEKEEKEKEEKAKAEEEAKKKAEADAPKEEIAEEETSS